MMRRVSLPRRAKKASCALSVTAIKEKNVKKKAATTPRNKPYNMTKTPTKERGSFQKFETKQRERYLHGQGKKCLIGVDEAGRGPLAGPVVAAAIHVPLDVDISGVRDSKKIGEPEELYKILTTHPRIFFSIVRHLLFR